MNKLCAFLVLFTFLAGANRYHNGLAVYQNNTAAHYISFFSTVSFYLVPSITLTPSIMPTLHTQVTTTAAVGGAGALVMRMLPFILLSVVFFNSFFFVI